LGVGDVPLVDKVVRQVAGLKTVRIVRTFDYESHAPISATGFSWNDQAHADAALKRCAYSVVAAITDDSPIIPHCEFGAADYCGCLVGIVSGTEAFGGWNHFGPTIQ
jgi:hypothetical protein